MIILKFFGIIILFFVIFMLTILFSIAFRFWGFFRQLLGNNNGQRQNNSQQNQWYRGEDFSSSTNSTRKDATVSGQPKPRNSSIDKNEGEYVDFEELS